MTIHIHHLTGCAPVPLAHYLKALGILRLIAEQKDPSARGWWKDEAFHLATTVEEFDSDEKLKLFFLEKYKPTPLISPWNGGSGFYDRKDSPLTPIEESSSERLRLFKEAIAVAREILAGRTEKPDKEAKRVLVRQIKSRFPDRLRLWLDVVALITSDGDDKYPALMGTGGNDGNLDFTDGFMRRLAEIYDLKTMTPRTDARQWIAGALWGEPTPGMIRGKSPGQFNPGTQGGANSCPGTKGKNYLNPFDFILTMEGSLLFIASIEKRADSSGMPSLAAPFSTHHIQAGVSSSGSEDDHGEQWMPLWTQPSSLADVQQLFVHGRARIGSNAVEDPIGFARAISRLGVSEGIEDFVRYGYFKRLGGMYFQAVPIGRYQVRSNIAQTLLDDLDAGQWMRKTRRTCADDDAPTAVRQNRRRIDEAVLACASHGANKTVWQELLEALGDFEARLTTCSGFTAKKHLQPIPRLSPGWLEVAADGSREFRLALALAGQSADGRGFDPVRRHWMPLDKFGRFMTDAGGLRKDPRVVCHGLDGQRDLLALVRRRIIEGEQNKNSRFPLIPARHCDAQLPDIAAFLAGDVDVQRVVTLARALMALDFKNLAHAADGVRGDEPPPLYGLFRIACLPWPLQRGGTTIEIRVDPAVVQRLAAGDLEGAGNLAIRRLIASGLVPLIRHVGGNDSVLARRLAACLAFPISVPTAGRLADRLTKPVINKQKGSAS